MEFEELRNGHSSDLKKKIYIATCSFGKDSIATLLLALKNNEPIDRVVYCEVMFDEKRNISAEQPEHIDFIYNKAIPKLKQMGLKIDIVRSKRDFVTMFHKEIHRTNKKERIGKVYGFPLGGACYMNKEKIAPMIQYEKQFKEKYDIVKYIGIAIDEPKRLKRLEGTNKVSLLAKYGYTEQMAMDLCKEYDLVSPLYEHSWRGGVGFALMHN